MVPNKRRLVFRLQEQVTELREQNIKIKKGKRTSLKKLKHPALSALGYVHLPGDSGKVSKILVLSLRAYFALIHRQATGFYGRKVNMILVLSGLASKTMMLLEMLLQLW